MTSYSCPDCERQAAAYAKALQIHDDQAHAIVAAVERRDYWRTRAERAEKALLAIRHEGHWSNVHQLIDNHFKENP